MTERRRFNHFFLTCPAIIVLGIMGCLPYNCEEPVPTASGSVQGIKEKDSGTCSWRGIPYAAPPVGEGRFRAPQDVEPWEGTLDAGAFGSPCWQPPTLLDPGQTDYFGGEDCLTLNIWRPRKKGRFPVMVYIHGGSFIVGAGSDPTNQGGFLAGGRDVVVVTLNYRLGPFGFLSHRALALEDPDGSTGNYGILDQIKALEWVRENIGAFGGDENNITVFGESAGAVSVCVLLSSPLTEGLFERAIMQSGGCDYCLSQEDGFDLGEQMVEAVGCEEDGDPIACLRERDSRTIIEALPFDPARFPASRYKCHVDGTVIPDQPLDMLQEGRYRPVPVIAGCNRDEYTTFMWFDVDLPSIPFNWDQYELQVRYRYREIATQVLDLYPQGSYPSPMGALGGIEGDRWFRCKMRASAIALSRYSADTFFYHFTFDDYWLGDLVGATHGLDVPFLFTSFNKGLWRLMFPLGPGEKASYMSELLMDYWTNFARYGDPNAEGLFPWASYDAVGRENIVLDVPVSLESDLLRDRCDFWDENAKGLD